jgi:hypothetical protein
MIGGRRETATLLAWCTLAGLAYLLAGTVASVAGMAMRGVVAGCVAGLTARGPRDLVRSAILGLASGVAGAGVGLAILSSMGISVDGGSALALACSALAAMVTAGALAVAPRRIAPWVSLSLVAAVFLSTVGVLPGQGEQNRAAIIRQRASIEPVADGAAADERIYRKTHFLMERGAPFYDAWAQAYAEDGTQRVRPQSMFQYRPPALFYLWRFLPGPVAERIWWWFAVFCVGGLALSFAVARRLVSDAAALLAPIGLSAYLAVPLMSTYFVLAEYWGVLFALACVYLIIAERPVGAAVALAAAVAIRELFVFMVPVYVVWWLMSPERARRHRVLGVALAVAVPVVLLGIHAVLARGSGGTGLYVSTWLNGGLDTLVRSLRFSGDLALGSGVLYLAAPMAALAGALMMRRRDLRVTLSAVVAIPVAALAVFSGGGATWSYWGAIAGPLLLTLWPSCVAPLLPPAAVAVRDAGPSAVQPAKPVGKKRRTR